jgi:SNF2 family DNA or RNA helicase
MKAFSVATKKYLSPPERDYALQYFRRDRLHLSLTRDIKKIASHFVADFYNPSQYSPTGRRMPSMHTITWAGQFPEGKKILGEADTFRLELPATDMVIERINHAMLPEQISFEDHETKIVYDEVLIRGLRADRNAEIYAKYKELKEVPSHTFAHSAEFPLACYQQVCLFNFYHTPGYGLLLEQGTGKTPIAIARICNEAETVFKNENRMYRALIVCPKNVRANWQSEFEKFATTEGKITVLRGTAVDRIRQIYEAITNEEGCKYSIVICSYETLTRSFQALQLINWDLGLLDESHYIKSNRTLRFKSAIKLRELCRSRAILTGTPITNTPLDLYTQFEFLGRGYSGFYTWKAFRKFFGQFRISEATGYEMLCGMQNIPFMQERLARYSFIVRQKDVMPELPDRVYDQIEIDMTDEQKQIYCEVRDRLAIEIENELDSNRPRQMVVNNVLTKLLRLAQITSGFVVWSPEYDDDGNMLQPQMVDRFDPDYKLETLVEILKEKKPTDKTIIWSCWVPNIKTIRARLAIENIDCVTFYGATKDEDRLIAEERFNCDPACKVFLGNPAAGGTGLNLIGYPPPGHEIYSRNGKKTPDDWETNCNHVIYYSQNWSPTARSQSEKRAHRRGTREPVRVTDLVVPGTIDHEIRVRVLAKQIRALEVSDLRKILDSVLTGQLVID